MQLLTIAQSFFLTKQMCSWSSDLWLISTVIALFLVRHMLSCNAKPKLTDTKPVFLRTLEYYSGILILTSNRVSIFDEAFKSRIQVALSYPRLDKASRKRVWANFINMIHEDGGRGPTEAGAKFCVDYPGIVSHMDDLADCELNGRQIRNAMATARQLAGYLGETLNWGHLETAITTASDFTISQSAP